MRVHETTDVVIIGAGAAGLAAGRALAIAGKRVTILEARNRIGGRILTHHVEAMPGNGSMAVELGAEFVHGLPTPSWSLLREAGLATNELGGDSYCFDGAELERCDERQRDSFNVLQKMQAWLEQPAAPADVSFADFLRTARIDPASAARAAGYVEGFNAADRDRVSARALDRQQRAEDGIEGERIFHIRSGYDALPNELCAQFKNAGGVLLLDSPVTEIRWSSFAVSVRTRDPDGNETMLEAPQVVITLPLGVLQANTVVIDPMPSDFARYRDALVMGDAERITLLFDHCFWASRAPRLGFLFAPTQLIPTWWTRAPESTPMLTGWAAGTGGMSRWREQGVRAENLESVALQALALIFKETPDGLRRSLLSSHHHDWHNDEYSRGAYSYVAVGGANASIGMSVPIEDTIFFAGEHTDVDDQWGTVHAALASGIRAAGQLLNRPPRR